MTAKLTRLPNGHLTMVGDGLVDPASCVPLPPQQVGLGGLTAFGNTIGFPATGPQPVARAGVRQNVGALPAPHWSWGLAWPDQPGEVSGGMEEEIGALMPLTYGAPPPAGGLLDVPRPSNLPPPSGPYSGAGTTGPTCGTGITGFFCRILSWIRSL